MWIQLDQTTSCNLQQRTQCERANYELTFHDGSILSRIRQLCGENDDLLSASKLERKYFTPATYLLVITSLKLGR